MSHKFSRSFVLGLSLAAVGACANDNTAAQPPSVDAPPAVDAAPDSPPAFPVVKTTTTVLASDAPGSTHSDPLLINPWGLALTPTGVIWVAANQTGKATIYDNTGTPAPLIVTLPVPPPSTDAAAPTGQVFNGTAADFLGDKFIMCTEEGTIVGWQDGTTGVIRVNRSVAKANFKGLAILNTGTERVIIAANFFAGTVDAWDASYAHKVLAGGTFVDPDMPAGFAPFNILVSGTKVFVAYARQDADKADDLGGPGIGAISLFDETGAFVRRVVTGGDLDSPWGMAITPDDFPTAPSSLLVGNFGDGAVAAYDITTGTKKVELADDHGVRLQIPGLWSLVFGHDTPNESHLQLLYTAGPEGETHGVLGRLDLVP